MATQRQIEANRLNAARSTGPKTDQGKARSRANATRHGLAGESAEVETEAGASPEFRARREEWAAERRPVGPAGHWALDRAVAASLRVERCERALDALCTAQAGRARLAWDEDRAVEAATVLGRLGRDPVLASAQLRASAGGVALLVEAWFVLIEALGSGADWSEAQAARALDLLGVAAEHRAGRTPIDDPEGGDPVAFRRALALDELEALETLHDGALVPLGRSERALAMSGDSALLSKPARLLLRYERDAWRRYREAMGQLQAGPEPEANPEPAMPEPPSVEPAPVAPEEDDEAWLERSLGARDRALSERSQSGGLGAVRVEAVGAGPRRSIPSPCPAGPA